MPKEGQRHAPFLYVVRLLPFLFLFSAIARQRNSKSSPNIPSFLEFFLFSPLAECYTFFCCLLFLLFHHYKCSCFFFLYFAHKFQTILQQIKCRVSLICLILFFLLRIQVRIVANYKKTFLDMNIINKGHENYK